LEFGIWNAGHEFQIPNSEFLIPPVPHALEGDPRRFAPTVLTLSIASSLLLYGLLYAAAPEVARLHCKVKRRLTTALGDIPDRTAAL